jgi:hypothetical protein
MGSLHYSLGLSADFDDRLLAHLQLVLGAKLRRGESFYFTWNEEHAHGNGRTTIWLHPALPLAFQYLGSRTAVLNKEWLEALSTSANSSTGLHVIPEPTASQPRRR